MRCCHLQQHGWTQRWSYKWSKSDRERQIHHLVGSKEIMQVSLFTKQKQTHRHRKQTWLPRGKVRSLKMSLKIHWSEVKWSESRSITSYSLWPHDCTVHGILQARMLEWVAFLFSRGSYQPRDQTWVSSIAGGFFTSWATREAQYIRMWSEVKVAQLTDMLLYS